MQVIVMLAENKDRAVSRYLDKFGRNRRESLPLIQLSNQSKIKKLTLYKKLIVQM